MRLGVSPSLADRLRKDAEGQRRRVHRLEAQVRELELQDDQSDDGRVMVAQTKTDLHFAQIALDNAASQYAAVCGETLEDESDTE